MKENKDNKDGKLLNHNPPVMKSVGVDCMPLKHTYDACFNTWFVEQFLQGSRDMSQCDELLKLYTDCVKKVMVQKGIDVTESDRGVREREAYSDLMGNSPGKTE